MLRDFEIIIREFPKNDDITIVPIADVHLGSKECREQDFIKFIKKVEETENMFLILGGDLIDNGTRNSVTNVFRASMTPSEQKREMANILKPVANKIICAVSGNHERRSRDADDDPTYDILTKIDCENVYRENAAFVKIRIGKANGDGEANPTYSFMVTHGAGGGQLTSGAVLRGERMGYAVDGIDAIIFGHTHRPFTTVPGKIFFDTRNNKVSVKPFKVINMSSWLDYTEYAMQKMLTPTVHNLHTITLKGNKKEMVVTM